MKSLNRINMVLLFLTQVSLMGFAQSGVITTYVRCRTACNWRAGDDSGH
jgi:hypothetical protein